LSLDPSGLAFIFTAGVFALFSPCGFPMLPGYISYYLGTKTSLSRAIPSGIACTLGLVVIFSIIGVIATSLGSLLSIYIPLLEIVAGIFTIFLGVIILLELNTSLFGVPIKAPTQKGFIGLFLYGIAYGMATLGCSAPIFFSILSYAITAGSFVLGIVTFIIYALGMGLPLIIITILIVETKKYILNRLVRLTPLIQKGSGFVLILIGLYLIYFYITVLSTT
jgi:cytochrome c biogenesis protein CcdA